MAFAILTRPAIAAATVPLSICLIRRSWIEGRPEQLFGASEHYQTNVSKIISVDQLLFDGCRSNWPVLALKSPHCWPSFMNARDDLNYL